MTWVYDFDCGLTSRWNDHKNPDYAKIIKRRRSSNQGGGLSNQESGETMKRELIGTTLLGTCFFICFLGELGKGHPIWMWIHLAGAIFLFAIAFIIWKSL